MPACHCGQGGIGDPLLRHFCHVRLLFVRQLFGRARVRLRANVERSAKRLDVL